MIIRVLFACGILSAALPPQHAHAQDATNPWPTPRSLGVDIPAFRPSTETGSTAVPQPTATVTLEQALQIALANNPVLAARAWEVRAGDGRILQATRLPNPEIEAEVENFGGSRDLRGFDSAETTLQISQLIELGGKRGKRQRVAEAEQAVAGWEYEAERLNVYATTSRAFFDVLAAQRQVELRERQLELALSVLEAVRERLTAGRVTELEETKARVEASISRIALERSRRELEASRGLLVAAWGGAPRSFGTAQGNLEALMLPPSFDLIASQLLQNPLVQRWEAEQNLRRSTLIFERSQEVPDVTLGAGIRHFSDTDDNAFVASVSIPLPVFGLNPGGVFEAEQRLPQGRAQARAAIGQLTANAQQAYSELSAVYTELRSLTDEVLPGAQEAYEAAQTGYHEGRFGFLDVLDAQRTLFDARARHIEALSGYHRARTDLERMTGHPLLEITSPSR